MKTDFDFFFGRWTVQHRRLAQRLAGCTRWVEFTGTAHAWPLLGGAGNVDDNWLDLPGGAYRAATFRGYDAARDEWAIWWLDGRRPHHLDVPVVGRFHDGVGEFFADDAFEGRPIRVRFRWSDTRSATPRWDQAFSPDGGATWETNWEMVFSRAP